MSVNHAEYGVPINVTKIRAEHPSNTFVIFVDVTNPVYVISQSDKRFILELTAITGCRAHIDRCSAP